MTSPSSVKVLKDLKCVGKMRIAKSKQVGGSIHVPACSSTLPPSQETEDIINQTSKTPYSKSDIIASIDIIKQILKTPYSKSPVSIAVQGGANTLVLNRGPNEEVEPIRSGETKNANANRQYHNFHELLGNLLLFNIEEYATESLGLRQQVTVSSECSTTEWLKSWLDNVMTDVPELAICNHLQGQGYELLPKGISEAFDPQVVQQNGLAVMEFLRSNCQEDPGVYWLHKMAGEDLFQLYDLSHLSTTHSSNASSLPLVFRACANEQFARLLLNIEEEFDLTIESNNVQRKVKIADLVEESLDLVTIVNHVCSVMNFTSGSVCQDPAPLPKATTRLISMQLAAVENVYRAIKSLMRTRQLLSSEQEGEWISTSTLDGKLWNLVLLLGESYLSLGKAYKEDGQLQQALNTVELACSIYGSVPHMFEEKFFVSALYKSFSLLLRIQNFQESVRKKNTSKCIIDEELVEDYISSRELSSKHLFWAYVWLLVGEIYFTFEVPPSPEGSEVVKKVEMLSDIVEEVEMLKRKLQAQRQNCASCSLVDCLCSAENKKRKGEKKSQNRKSKGEDKSVRGGIFKYLTSLRKGDAERNMLTALHCVEETQRALHGCKDLKSLYERKEFIWFEISLVRLEKKNFKDAEEALANSIKNCRTPAGNIAHYLNFGVMRQELALEKKKLALEKESEMRAMQLQLTAKGYKKSVEATTKAHKKAVEATIEEIITSLRYFIAAEKELSLALKVDSSVPEDLRVKPALMVGHSYGFLGFFLLRNDTTAAAPPELKIQESTHGSSSSGRLSAIDALEKALDAYESLEKKPKLETAIICKELGQYHRDCGLKDNGIKHATLADKYWQKALECYGSLCHPFFLKVLVESSIHSFNRLPRQPNFIIETNLSRFLGCYEMFKAAELDEEDLKNFWDQLKKILKEMVTQTKSLSTSADKEKKLRALYGTALRAPTQSLSSLKDMIELWTSHP